MPALIHLASSLPSPSPSLANHRSAARPPPVPATATTDMQAEAGLVELQPRRRESTTPSWQSCNRWWVELHSTTTHRRGKLRLLWELQPPVAELQPSCGQAASSGAKLRPAGSPVPEPFSHRLPLRCFCWNRHVILLELACFFATINLGALPC